MCKHKLFMEATRSMGVWFVGLQRDRGNGWGRKIRILLKCPLCHRNLWGSGLLTSICVCGPVTLWLVACPGSSQAPADPQPLPGCVEFNACWVESVKASGCCADQGFKHYKCLLCKHHSSIYYLSSLWNFQEEKHNLRDACLLDISIVMRARDYPTS